MIAALFPLLRPLIFAFPPETAHTLTLKALATGLYPRDRTPPDPRLAQTVFGIRFSNPLGIAAGFDKNAEALGGLFALGFGHVEAGTVTPRPQEGNPKPRLFRDPSTRSVINRMGFPNKGVRVFLENYRAFRTGSYNETGIVGINIGKNKATQDATADYLELIDHLAPHADYLAVNVSSPNTPGLRDLQKRSFLLPFLHEVRQRRAAACAQEDRVPPILVKLAPDLSDHQVDELGEVLLESGVDGVILTNTTIDRPDALPPAFSKETGGLSGPYVRNKSTVMIRRFYSNTRGALPIIGVGGISSAADAYAKIRAGATLLQLYTALVFEGPGLIRKIREGLVTLLDRDGFHSISEAVGIDSK